MFGVGVKLEEGSKNWKLRKFKDLKNSLVKADYRLNSRARFREKLSHIGRDTGIVALESISGVHPQNHTDTWGRATQSSCF